MDFDETKLKDLQKQRDLASRAYRAERQHWEERAEDIAKWLSIFKIGGKIYGPIYEGDQIVDTVRFTYRPGFSVSMSIDFDEKLVLCKVRNEDDYTMGRYVVNIDDFTAFNWKNRIGDKLKAAVEAAGEESEAPAEHESLSLRERELAELARLKAKYESAFHRLGRAANCSEYKS